MLKSINLKSTGLIIVLLGMFILAGCTLNQGAVQTDDTSTPVSQEGKKSADVAEGHIGCQEGEINEDGTCVPASKDDNNASLFGQDLDQYVDSEEISDDAVGFLAKPKAEGNYPGVVMIHEWWGLNDNIREMAKLLAKEGYVVFAVDLYNGEVAKTSDQARTLATAVRNNPDQAIADMQAAADYLRENYEVDRLGSIGWCFGGQHSLFLSLNEPLDTTVIYYGQLISDTGELEKIAGPVLGIFGSEDTSISVESVNAFEDGLNQVGIENDIYIYPGVGHAFANPSGTSYAETETVDAWNKTVAFLNSNLKTVDSNATTAEEDNLVIFNLTGENFKFVMDGEDNPELRVKVGDKVRVEFTSTQGFHDFVVDEFDAATEQVNSGDSTSVEFTADQAGTFEYYCSVGSHRQMGMFGQFVVE